MLIPRMKEPQRFVILNACLGLIPVKYDSSLDGDSRNHVGEYQMCSFSVHRVPFIYNSQAGVFKFPKWHSMMLILFIFHSRTALASNDFRGVL